MEIAETVVKKDTPRQKKKSGKKRKLTKTNSVDSTSNNSEMAAEAVSMKNNDTEEGDIQMDSMRMTDDYKIITKLRETVWFQLFLFFVLSSVL